MSSLVNRSVGTGLESVIDRLNDAAARPGTRGERLARIVDACVPRDLPYGLELRSDVADPIVQDGPGRRCWHFGLQELVDADPGDTRLAFSFAVSRSPRAHHFESFDLAGLCVGDAKTFAAPQTSLGTRARGAVRPLPLERARIGASPLVSDAFDAGELMSSGGELRRFQALLDDEIDALVSIGASHSRSLLGAVLVARSRGHVLLSADAARVDTLNKLREPFVVASSHFLAHQLAKRLDQERDSIFRAAGLARGRQLHDDGTSTPSFRHRFDQKGESGERQDEKSNLRFFVPHVFRHDPRGGASGFARRGE